MGMKSGGGEIVQVQGGHIVRSTGRKDRHSKVYTAKGPRDRRVRLSAHTAIQFYDVQDRLGFDRPSKAVDWLIKKAQAAIEKLAELPPWHDCPNPDPIAPEMHIPDQAAYNLELPDNPNAANSSFLPRPLDSDAITDTMKSFFPTTSAASSVPMNFQTYPPDIITRAGEDLGLSLHSFHEPTLQGQDAPHGGLPGGFDANLHRLVGWGSDGGSRGGFGFSTAQAEDAALLGHASAFSEPQRGTLQSSFSPPVRTWTGLPIQNHRPHASAFGARFSSDGFCIPAEEEHGLVSDRPSSSSHSSHH